MANTAIVASNIVGIRLVRAISEALQSLDQRSALDRPSPLLPCQCPWYLFTKFNM